jgi:hypothetical protein
VPKVHKVVKVHKVEEELQEPKVHKVEEELQGQV